MVSFKEIYFAYQYKGKEKGDKGTYLMAKRYVKWFLVGLVWIYLKRIPKITSNGWLASTI